MSKPLTKSPPPPRPSRLRSRLMASTFLSSRSSGDLEALLAAERSRLADL